MKQLKTKCLNSLFVCLGEKNIPYCVVGDSRSLPDDIPSDIDVVISRDDFELIRETIYQFSLEVDCRLVQMLRHEQTAVCFVLSISNVGGGTCYLTPDICCDYYCNGKELFSAVDILAGRRLARSSNGDSKQFYIPTADVEFAYYSLKKIEKSTINQEQFDHMQEQYLQSPEECKARVLKYWSQKEVDTIVGAMENGDFELLKNALPHLKEQLATNTHVSINDRWQEFKRKVSRVLQPTGLVLVFLGPDGAGKTAIGDRLEKELAPAFRGFKRFHLRPSVFGKSLDGGNTPVTNPHEKTPRGLGVSIAKLVYFLADYLLGYISRILPLKMKSHLVIFDRYFHDLLVDPVRYRYGAPAWMASMTSWLIPKPDLFIVLDAPAEVIHARKQEVPLEETKRQREAYLEFARNQANCIVLDTSVGIDETVNKGCFAVLDYMQNRQQKRLNVK